MNDSPLFRIKISRAVRRAVTVMLFSSLSVPAWGLNYSLHSPMLWSPEEKAQFEKDNPQPKPVVAKRIAPKKKKAQVKKDQILVKDGVSYREVVVLKGDSLARIARKFRKSNASYADVLLFNGLKPADVIRAGDVIKVPIIADRPVTKPSAAKETKKAEVAANPQPAVKAAVKPIAKHIAAPARAPDTGKKSAAVRKTAVKPVAPVHAGAVSMVPRRPAAFVNSSTARRKEARPAEIAVLKPAIKEAVPAEIEAQPTSAGLTGQKLFESAVKAYRQDDCVTAVRLFAKFLSENTDSLFAPDASLYDADCYLKLSGKNLK